MQTETIVALVAALGAVLAAGVSALSALLVTVRRADADKQIAALNQSAQLAAAREATKGAVAAAETAADIQRELRSEERLADLDAVVGRFRRPLLHAAFELQSRLWNILCKDFVARYYASGTERQKSYVVSNTLFVIAQYFCWIEIIRREIQFLDIGDETIALSKLRNRIYHLWQSDIYDHAYMIWAGEQRAIGEALIVERQSGRECMGYAAFTEQLDAGDLSLLSHIRSDIELSATDPSHGRERLEAIQAELVQVLQLLDPDNRYFPERLRSVAADRST